MIRQPPKSPLFPYPPLSGSGPVRGPRPEPAKDGEGGVLLQVLRHAHVRADAGLVERLGAHGEPHPLVDRKSTRLNSSHANISYAVFCLTKKKAPARTNMLLR